IETLEAERADLVSVVVPIKTPHGHTSTAVVDLDGNRRRRLTVREVASLPAVFDAAVAGKIWGVEKTTLAVNPRLWGCGFATLPAVEELYFRNGDSIRTDASGRFHAHTQPEDWLWSMDFAARGLKVVATTRVPVRHYGHTAFGIGIEAPWGAPEPD